MKTRGMDGNKAKVGRWRRDAQGKYHYRGKCPFNRAVCWLRNRFNTGKEIGKEEVPQ